MSEAVAPPRTLGWRATAIVLLTAALTLFAFLGYRATLTEHEVFAAQPAREMLAGGSVVLQPFAGAFRVKKPPGQSWLIAASMGVTRVQNEFSARLPSAIAGTMLALLVGALGARLASRRVGLVAALMTLTTHGVQARARLAEADMALTFTIVVAYASVIWKLVRPPPLEPTAQRSARVGMEDGSAVARSLVFWFAITTGVFLKGPIVLAFVSPPLVIAYAILRVRGDRDAARSIRRTTLHPVPLVLCVLVVAAWVTAAVRLHPEVVAAWRHEVVDRATGEMRRDSPLKYLSLLSLAALPWLPFAVIASAGGPRRWGDALRGPAVFLLGIWFAFGFVMISCVALKALHYALPILPPLILLAAVGFDRALDRWLASRPPDRRPTWERAALIAWFGIASLAWVAGQLWFDARRTRDEAVRRFAAQVERAVPSDAPIYLVGVGEERTAWYLHRRLVQTRRLADDGLLTQIDRLPADRAYVLCRVPTVGEIAARAGARELARSDDYRGRDEDQERRALLLVEPVPQ